MFKPINPNPNFPQIEEEILQFWKKNKIFEKSVELRPKDKQWTFLDGPPFITGLPHYGSLLSSIPKDLFPRFWTMKGYRVRRVWGWDCHGLPAENKVEEKLNIKRKKDIEEKIGIGKFIDECKKYVSQISSEWEWYIDNIGRWVDFKNAYKTMDFKYMKTVMWVFGKMYEKGLIYKGLRVSLYCPHCATPISNFEVAMDAENYKEVAEPANIYKFQLKNEKDTYFLAWSTTPWNKIVTMALAVNPDIIYVKISSGKEKYILAEKTLKILKDKQYKILEKLKGSDLVGIEFIPSFDFHKVEKDRKAYIIIGDDFVSSDEGTGIVTIAAYGEEDLTAMQKNNIQIVLHLDENGVIKPDILKFGGMHYLSANKLVNQDLEKRGLMYSEYNYTHTIPTCWRCHTRLYYAPQDAWYVDIQSLKSKLKKNNEKINWFSAHFKYGRFLKSMEAAPDWCISRSRFWGSPVPVWECGCGTRFVPKSIEELEKASGQKIKDLHKPEIDRVIISCNKCGKDAKRVSEVLDSWIEAGSASFAERHYPFEKNIRLEDFFPPDFITEYTGQIRAWFYVLHVIGVSLFDSNAFKNVLVSGVILGTDGRKMSKNYGNYPDPKEMIKKYGGDALRLYLMGSPVMKGEDILISEEQYRNQIRGILLILWNVYNFFVTYANIDGWSKSKNTKSKNVLDQWIISLLNQLINGVTEDLEKYDTVSPIVKLQKFIDNFSRWYIRRSRSRVGLSVKNSSDKNAFYTTCYQVLVTLCHLLAPFTPFIAEYIYKNLTDKESVHLSDWPQGVKELINSALEEQMDTARKIVETVHAERKRFNIKLRQPLEGFLYDIPKQLSKEIELLMAEETNVENVRYLPAQAGEPTGSKLETLFISLKTDLTPDLIAKGQAREIIRQIQKERKKLGFKPDDMITATIPNYPKEYEDLIKKKVMAKDINQGDILSIKKYS